MNERASNPQLIDGRQSSYWEYQMFHWKTLYPITKN